jgi:hypothetical protein
LGDVCAEEDAGFRLAELEVGRGALLLFLFTVDVSNGHINIVQEVRVELYCVT